MDNVFTWVDFLKLSGPYGLVAICAWAYWVTSEKRDRDLKAFFEMLRTMNQEQTVAIIEMKNALLSLRESLLDSIKRGR